MLIAHSVSVLLFFLGVLFCWAKRTTAVDHSKRFFSWQTYLFQKLKIKLFKQTISISRQKRKQRTKKNLLFFFLFWSLWCDQPVEGNQVNIGRRLLAGSRTSTKDHARHEEMIIRLIVSVFICVSVSFTLSSLRLFSNSSMFDSSTISTVLFTQRQCSCCFGSEQSFYSFKCQFSFRCNFSKNYVRRWLRNKDFLSWTMWNRHRFKVQLLSTNLYFISLFGVSFFILVIMFALCTSIDAPLCPNEKWFPLNGREEIRNISTDSLLFVYLIVFSFQFYFTFLSHSFSCVCCFVSKSKTIEMSSRMQHVNDLSSAIE